MFRFVLFLSLFFILSCRSHTDNRPQNLEEVSFDSVNGPYIDFYQDTLELGDIKQGEKVNAVFRFKNKGKSDLLITSVQAGCGCTSTEWDPKPIPAGKDSEIKIVFNSTGKKGRQVKTIDVTSNAQIHEKRLRFTCNVVTSN